MTREEAIILIERAANELREMMKTITMPTSAAEQLQQEIDAHEIAISALRQKEQEGNDPLTLDELRKMDGEPVWVVWPDGRIKSQWFIISSTFWIEMFQEWDGTLSKDYGKTWLAYRQKPEEGTR